MTRNTALEHPVRGITATALLLGLVCIFSCSSPEDTPLISFGSPESAGLDEERLNDLTAHLSSGEFGLVSSLLIARKDNLVYEEYFLEMRRGRTHRVYSVTKSFTSALIGIALDEGLIPDLDMALLDFFPEYPLVNHMDPRKARITLRHVLQMRAGFEWDEWSTPYTSSSNPVSHLSASGDWMKFMLDLPMAHEPGTFFRYNSGCTMLLSGILRNVTGMSAEAYARAKLMEPLGIESYQWEAGPGNITNTGWGLYLTPRDMLRFGQLYLYQGNWEGEQLIPGAWIVASTERYTTYDFFQRRRLRLPVVGDGYGH
jgi:CubicO group peptidase (beta-lactamase class C family)